MLLCNSSKSAPNMLVVSEISAPRDSLKTGFLRAFLVVPACLARSYPRKYVNAFW